MLAFAPTLAPSQTAYREVEVKNGGTIRGTVRLAGDPANLPAIPITKDNTVCGKNKANPTLIVGKNAGVKNSIVYLDGITQGKKMSELMKPVLDQVRCEYEPHVVIVPSGGKMEIVNSDTVLHTVHAYNLSRSGPMGLMTVFNLALPVKGMRIPKQVTTNGILLNLCDTGHAWMIAYVITAEHPYYAVTDADGNFNLDNVPPGTYTLRMWHEPVLSINEKTTSHSLLQSKEYVQENKVTVTSGGTQTVVFDLIL